MKHLVTMALMAATGLAAAQGKAEPAQDLVCVSAAPGKELCTGTVAKRKIGEALLVFDDAPREQEIRGAGEASVKTADLSRPAKTAERRKAVYVTGEDWCKDNKR